MLESSPQAGGWHLMPADATRYLHQDERISMLATGRGVVRKSFAMEETYSKGTIQNRHTVRNPFFAGRDSASAPTREDLLVRSAYGVAGRSVRMSDETGKPSWLACST